MKNKNISVVATSLLIVALGIIGGFYFLGQLNTSPQVLGEKEEKKITPVSTPFINRFDLNGDQKVDEADLSAWQELLQKEDLQADLNLDGKVSVTDYEILYGQVLK